MVESIQLVRQIAVRAIVTENFKAQVGNEINRNLQQIDAELQQLEFKGKRAISEIEKRAGGAPSGEARIQIDQVRQQVDTEKARLTQMKERNARTIPSIERTSFGQRCHPIHSREPSRSAGW